MNTDKIINIFTNLSEAGLMKQDEDSDPQYISSKYLFNHENFVLKFIKLFDDSLSETTLKIDVLDFESKEIFSLKINMGVFKNSPLISIENKYIQGKEEQEKIISSSPIYDVLDILQLKTDTIIKKIKDEKNELAEKAANEQTSLVQKTLDRMRSLREKNNLFSMDNMPDGSTFPINDIGKQKIK